MRSHKYSVAEVGRDSGIPEHLTGLRYRSAPSRARFHPTFPYRKKIITIITNKNAMNLTDILQKLNKPDHKIETGRKEIKINKQPQTLVLKSAGVLEITRNAGDVTNKIYTAIGTGYFYNICAYLNSKYVLLLMWMQRLNMRIPMAPHVWMSLYQRRNCREPFALPLCCFSTPLSMYGPRMKITMAQSLRDTATRG